MTSPYFNLVPRAEALPDLHITGDPGKVWRVGFAPDPWAWAGWEYATEPGNLFPGRWDDQMGEFRTVYTADRLLGCFLELLARFRPSQTVQAAVDEVEDDDGSGADYPDAAPGAVGYSWLEGRLYGSAQQTGRYCAITHSRSIAALTRHYPFSQHGLSVLDVDAALLKDARDRVLTRSIARWLYDLHHLGHPRVDGVEFASRHGDELRMWAVFERSDSPTRSTHIRPLDEPAPVTPDRPELIEAFNRYGLHWHDDA
jgi:hypothetical protein